MTVFVICFNNSFVATARDINFISKKTDTQIVHYKYCVLLLLPEQLIGWIEAFGLFINTWSADFDPVLFLVAFRFVMNLTARRWTGRYHFSSPAGVLVRSLGSTEVVDTIWSVIVVDPLYSRAHRSRLFRFAVFKVCPGVHAKKAEITISQMEGDN